MQETWRWFGPSDPVSLADVRQTGATGIVTALHHVPNGRVWSVAEIEKRKREIESAGLAWSVVESIPVSEDIKTRSGDFRSHIEAYRQSIRNLARCGVRTVCYNFMPVIDWTRTDLAYRLPEGGLALRFDADLVAAFDLYILKRQGAEADHDERRQKRAKAAFDAMTDTDRERLVRNIIAGLPGSEESYTLDMFRAALARYDGVGADELRQSLAMFLEAVVPVAEEEGVRLAIHPDDPPRSLFGLPRVLGTASDARWLLDHVDSPANGLTFCTGSYGVRPDNDLVGMMRAFGARVHFVHLRATKREDDPESFHEAGHLDGDVDMVAMIGAILAEEKRRREAGRDDHQIPMRPDHGHQLLDDQTKAVNPGYSAIGRLKGLAELRGVARALNRH